MITPKKKLCDGLCREEKVIWKNYLGKRYCKQCWSCHEDNVKQIKPTVKRKPLPLRSTKRTKEERLYSAKRIIYLNEHEVCMIHLPGICTNRTTDIHHSYSGKDRGQFFLDEKTWFATCRACHNWCHTNSKEARELGFLK